MPELTGTYAVLLNWNGWRDSIACLESLLPDMRRGLRVVLCDNASGDGSLTQVACWAAGHISAPRTGNPRLDRLLQCSGWRPETKSLTRREAEQGEIDRDAALLLVDNGANLGFAAGNNVGMRAALRDPDMRQLWLLNNDTLVEADCLAAMHRRLAKHPGPAVCGAMVHFFDRPEILQCIGGNRFDYRRGRALESEGRYLPEHSAGPVAAVEARLDYLSGCCMLLPRAFLETVGLMCEDYFLYYEEIDWFTRAAGRFDLLVAADARLYHREGSAIGSRSWRRGPSLLADRHMIRSRRLYVDRHTPQARRHCALANWGDVGKRLLRGQWRNALLISRLLLGGAPGGATGRARA